MEAYIFFALPFVIGLIPGLFGVLRRIDTFAFAFAFVWAGFAWTTVLTNEPDHIGMGQAITGLFLLGAMIGLTICAVAVWRHRNVERKEK